MLVAAEKASTVNVVVIGETEALTTVISSFNECKIDLGDRIIKVKPSKHF